MRSDFDGLDDYVTFGPAPDVGVSNFTIEAWFRRDGPDSAEAVGDIISRFLVRGIASRAPAQRRAPAVVRSRATGAHP